MSDIAIRDCVAKISGLLVFKSRYYRGRYECVFFGRQGPAIKEWIRQQFGDSDDLVYASEEDTDVWHQSYSSLITEAQLNWVLLRWS